MRIFWGIVLGLALFFPGTILVQWFGQDVLGCKEMTITDACLVLIIILLSVIIVTGAQRRELLSGSARRQPAVPGSETEPYPGQQPARGVRRPTRRSSRRPSARR